MVEWIKYFDNASDFGMEFLMRVPDQCIAFLGLMLCLMVVLSIRVKGPHGEEAWERED